MSVAPQESPESRIDDGRSRPLDPSYVVVQRLAGAITSSIIGGGTLVGAVLGIVLGRPPAPFSALIALGWLAQAALLAFFSLGWPAIAYRRISYALTPEALQIQRGVVWRSTTTVPRSRVQHTDVSQGPIERAFDLSTLIVYTAGTEHASVSLGGLKHATALAMRDLLIEVGHGDAV